MVAEMSTESRRLGPTPTGVVPGVTVGESPEVAHETVSVTPTLDGPPYVWETLSTRRDRSLTWEQVSTGTSNGGPPTMTTDGVHDPDRVVPVHVSLSHLQSQATSVDG